MFFDALGNPVFSRVLSTIDLICQSRTIKYYKLKNCEQKGQNNAINTINLKILLYRMQY
jgi:hypothetical protein